MCVTYGGREEISKASSVSLPSERYVGFINAADPGGRDAAHSEWSVLSTDALLRQFGHRQRQVPAGVSHVPVVSAEFGVFQTVAPHLGVLVVDGVDEEEDDGDGHYGDSHKSGDEGQVVLF